MIGYLALGIVALVSILVIAAAVASHFHQRALERRILGRIRQVKELHARGASYSKISKIVELPISLIKRMIHFEVK